MTSKRILYVCEIIILHADHVPIGDLPNLSCDPYIKASVEVPSVYPDFSRPPLSFRTPTIRRTLNPVYNSRWIISGIPDNGFTLTLRLLDEDTGHHDDRLGEVTVHLPVSISGNSFSEGWDSGEVECKVEKRKGRIRTHLATYVATWIAQGRVSHHSRIWIRARVIRKADDQEDRRVYTLGPPCYTRHFSPLIGHLISGGTAANMPGFSRGKNNKPLGVSTFVANRLQLSGPPPRSLRHRYVGYAPFIKSLFKKSGIRGKLLNYALHRQYKTVYGYGKSTVFGVAGEGDLNTDGSQRPPHKEMNHEKDENAPREQLEYKFPDEANGLSRRDHPLENTKDHAAANDPEINSHDTSQSQSYSKAMGQEFLSMTSYGTAGRIFTYVITLDSEWRFTETGEEFAVDLLSKHSMHADVAKEIAFSGEFFVRRIAPDGTGECQVGSHEKECSSRDPKDYELVIDNDSGTYRPKKELLPVLQKWLAQDNNLGALGRVLAMDGFDETLKKWKQERKEEKRMAKGLGKQKDKGKTGREKEQTEGAEKSLGKMAIAKSASSVSSIGSSKLGSRASSISSNDVRSVLQEDAKRARENQDDDEIMVEEEERETEAPRVIASQKRSLRTGQDD